MGFWDRLKRAPPDAPNSATDITLGYYIEGANTVALSMKSSGQFGGDIASQISSRREIPADDIGLALAYASNPTAYRCVDLRSRKVAEMPHRIKNKQTGAVITGHPLDDALELSRLTYKKHLLYAWESSRCLHGETYIEKVGDTYARPATFKWLNPIAIEPYDVGSGGILYYDYTDPSSGVYHRFSLEEIVFDLIHNPLDDLRGLGPMQIALNSVNVHNYIQQHTKAFFQNGARPGGILTAKQGTHIARPEQEKLLEWWKDQLQGPNKRNKTIFMPSPLEFQDVQQSPSPEQVKLETSEERKICEALGVPMQLVNSEQERQLSASEDQLKLFYENTVIPECEAIAAVMNSEMMPFVDPTGQFIWEFDYDKVRALVDDQVKRATSMNSRLISGNATLNEARRYFGDPEVPDGDILFVPKANQPIAMKDLKDIATIIAEAQQPATQGVNQDQQLPPKGNGNKPGTVKAVALDELRQWQKKAFNHGIEKARGFKVVNLPDDVAEIVRTGLYGFDADTDRGTIKALFDSARIEVSATLDETELADLADRLQAADLEELAES